MVPNHNATSTMLQFGSVPSIGVPCLFLQMSVVYTEHCGVVEHPGGASQT